MGIKTVTQRIRLHNGTEFSATFHQRSSSLVVVEAEGRASMRVRKETPSFAARSVWAARVDGKGLTFYDANPAKAFDACVLHSWHTAVDGRSAAK